MISATDGGVFKSHDTFADTVAWTSLNNGYYTTQLYGVSISRNANSNVMHGGFQDNGNFINFSANPTSHWNMPFNGDGAFGGIADNEEDFFLGVVSANQLYQLVDLARGEVEAWVFVINKFQSWRTHQRNLSLRMVQF